jgi:hypothetical protein
VLTLLFLPFNALSTACACDGDCTCLRVWGNSVAGRV